MCESYSLHTVPAPSVTVTINYNTDGFAFDTGQVTLLCSTILQGFESDTITPNSSITWTSSQSMISDDPDYSISMQSAIISDSVYLVNSTLLKSALNVTTDNGIVYNCAVDVGVSMLYERYQYIESNIGIGSSQPLNVEGECSSFNSEFVFQN